jgi:hypothetical protein
MSAVTGGILNPYISYIHNIFNMRKIHCRHDGLFGKYIISIEN